MPSIAEGSIAISLACWLFVVALGVLKARSSVSRPAFANGYQQNSGTLLIAVLGIISVVLAFLSILRGDEYLILASFEVVWLQGETLRVR